jgi:hypothetical protein
VMSTDNVVVLTEKSSLSPDKAQFVDVGDVFRSVD